MSAFTPYTGSATGTTAGNGPPAPRTPPVVYIQNDGYAIVSANSFQQSLETLANNVTYLLDGYVSNFGQLSFKSIVIDGIGGQVVAPADGSLNVSQNAIIHGITECVDELLGTTGTFSTDEHGKAAYLDGYHGPAVTTLSIGSTAGFPTSGKVKLNSEHVTYTSISSVALVGCSRGVDGSIAQGHNDQTPVSLIFSASLSTPQLSPDISANTLYSNNIPAFCAIVAADGYMLSGFGIDNVVITSTGVRTFTTHISSTSNSGMVIQATPLYNAGPGIVIANAAQTGLNTFYIITCEVTGTPGLTVDSGLMITGWIII